MTAEQKLHEWLKKQLPPRTDYQRIENFDSGMPDANVIHHGHEVWLELKIVTHNRTLLRKAQYAWGYRRANYRGDVFVISFDEERNNILTWKYPRIEIKPYGKYLEIVTDPWTYMKEYAPIKNILFPELS
jgi:hypothetical protein